MNKIKIIGICLLILLVVFTALFILKVKHKEDLRQRSILAQDMHKGLQALMLDIYQSPIGSFEDLPADGLWHDRIFFKVAHQGILQYKIKEGFLIRIFHGHQWVVANNITGLHIRRQRTAPDILEVQIEAHKNVTLISDLKIRVKH